MYLPLVWGKVIEVDFYSEECTYTNNIYSSTIPGYENEYFKIVGIDDLSIIKKNIIDATSDIRFNQLEHVYLL